MYTFLSANRRSAVSTHGCEQTQRSLAGRICPAAATGSGRSLGTGVATIATRWRCLVASGDHRLAQIPEYGEVHVVVWEGHPLASRLESAAVAVYRLPWPTRATPRWQPRGAGHPNCCLAASVSCMGEYSLIYRQI